MAFARLAAWYASSALARSSSRCCSWYLRWYSRIAFTFSSAVAYFFTGINAYTIRYKVNV